MIYVIMGLGFVLGVAFGYWRVLVERQKQAPVLAKVQLQEQSLQDAQATIDDLRADLKSSQESNIVAQTQLENLQDVRNGLSDSFAALSKDALQSNNEMFLKLAQTSLEKVVHQAKGRIDQKEESIASMVKPLQETLKRYEDQTKQMEEGRQKAFGSLEEQLRSLIDANKELKMETGNLVSALKKPQVRGRWGEMTLKRVAELAGLVEHCDFFEQTQVETDEGQNLRPDMLVKLPNGRCIVIDAKVPLQAYLEALEAKTDEERDSCLLRHSQHVVTHMRQLAKKSYWDQFEDTPEFVVMFIPGESFFSVAMEYEKNLIEDGVNQQVIISTPTTLIALLKAVSYGWRQEQITQNAQDICALGKEVHDRLAKFIEHYGKVGKAIERATESYNQSVGSLESRVLVSARKFKEMGVSSKNEITDVTHVEKIPKLLDVAGVE